MADGRERRQDRRDQGRRARRRRSTAAAGDLQRAPHPDPGSWSGSWSPRCSSTWATTASARSRWTPPTAWPAAARSIDTGAPISVPVGDVTLGRIFNVLGEAIDKGEADPERRASAGRSTATRRAFDELDAEAADPRDRHQGHRPARAVHARRQDRPVRRRRRRQDGADPGADQQHRQAPRRQVGVRRRRRAHARGQRPLARDDRVGRASTQTALVYGQMNEPPGARLRVALSGLTMAEYFRDTEGADVLLFIDNIFRFTQAGSEVSALLGRMPSAVGYQPTLATEMGELQERITSTQAAARSRRCRPSTCPPTTSPTRRPPPRSPTSTRPRCSRARSRRRASTRPSTRSTRRRASSSRTSSATSTTASRPPCSGCCSATRTCRTSSRSSAWTSCPTRTS